MSPVADAIVVGGGVIGKAVALALAERGAKVTLCDGADVDAATRRRPATRAAAGILGAQMEAHADGPLTRLCLASRSRFEAFAKHVESKGGHAVEYRASGVTVAAFDEGSLARLRGEAGWQREASLRVEELDRRALREFEPDVADEAIGGLRFPDDARVDPRGLLDALGAALARAGVTTRTRLVRRVLRDGGRAIGIEDEDGATHAENVVLCAGSWSALVSGSGLGEADVGPARGQMLELRARPGLLRGVVLGPGAYLSPRDDGRILVGATVERVGFDERTTAAATRDLLTSAIRIAPALANASLSDSWAGLRPATNDELPLIGEGVLDRLVIATGHFRNGILLAPITAEIVAALIEERAPPVDIEAFSPSRFARFA